MRKRRFWYSFLYFVKTGKRGWATFSTSVNIITH